MNTSADAAADWREIVFADSTPLTSSATVRCLIGSLDGQPAVVAAWDFSNQGGSFGEADADAFVAATDAAIERRLPLVTLLRSGGTRLPEGMRALVGIPRTALALGRLAAAGSPHFSVMDHPTMGGVWVAIGSTADLRIAVEGALVGFSGPRAVAAMTGRDLPEGANTAAAAYDAGLVDAVATPDSIITFLGQAIRVVTTDAPTTPVVPEGEAPPTRDAWDQVVASRTVDRADGQTLIGLLLSDCIALRGADSSVAAAIGQLEGRRAVAVALASTRATMPTPNGYALMVRAAKLAGTLDLALIVLVDTPGADPHTESLGLAASIASGLRAVIDCPAPTISLVHGEGGSGGALAGAVTDVVGIGPDAWFAAMGPEGAAATLRIDPSEAARQMHITPNDLLASGFGDVYVPTGLEGIWLATTIDRLRQQPAADRLAKRQARWSAPLPGH